MFGAVNAAFGVVVDFRLGSNEGSHRTMELLSHATPIGP